MKIRITQKEIAQILLAAVTSQIQFKAGSEPTIDFTATRGDDGIVAEIDVPYMGVGSLDLSTPNTTTSTPAAPDNKAEPELEVPAKPKGTRGKPAGKALFGDLTKPSGSAQDAAAEQTNDGPEAGAGADDPPFATTSTASAEVEPATDQGTEGDAEQAQTPPPPKGKSLFDT